MLDNPSQYKKGDYVVFESEIRIVDKPSDDDPTRYWLHPLPHTSRACAPESMLEPAPDIPTDPQYVIDVETATDEELLDALDKLENDRLFHSTSVTSTRKKKERKENKIKPTDITIDSLQARMTEYLKNTTQSKDTT